MLTMNQNNEGSLWYATPMKLRKSFSIYQKTHTFVWSMVYNRMTPMMILMEISMKKTPPPKSTIIFEQYQCNCCCVCCTLLMTCWHSTESYLKLPKLSKPSILRSSSTILYKNSFFVRRWSWSCVPRRTIVWSSLWRP